MHKRKRVGSQLSAPFEQQDWITGQPPNKAHRTNKQTKTRCKGKINRQLKAVPAVLYCTNLFQRPTYQEGTQKRTSVFVACILQIEFAQTSPAPPSYYTTPQPYQDKIGYPRMLLVHKRDHHYGQRLSELDKTRTHHASKKGVAGPEESSNKNKSTCQISFHILA